MNKFDRVFWNRLWSLTRLYWFSDERREGVRLLVICAGLSAASLALGAYSTYLYRDSTNALVGKHPSQFYHLMLVWTAFVAVSLPVGVLYPWYGERMHIIWREWLTHYFIEAGFAHRAFYRMGVTGKVDNPDQRISDDVDSFIGATQIFTVVFVSALGGVGTYFGILWSISRSLALILIGYAIVGSYFTVVIGRRLIGINYDQERYQADFRFGLVHVRDNTEPIFMYGGEAHEAAQLRRRFAKVVENFNLLIAWQRNLAFFTQSYGGVISLVPYWFLAGTFFAGRLDYGRVVQAATAFMSLHGSLSIIVNTFPGLANFANVVSRLGGYLEECEAARTAELGDRPRIETVEDGSVAFAALTIRTPDMSRAVVSDLSASVSALEPVLIRGPSGVGKTSLIRAIASIWQEGGGRVIRPKLSEVMFLPQRPYMILGSLRDQLTYPHAGGAEESELSAILADVNLAGLPERFGGLDAEMHWADVLSPGEQQRLAFARLLLNRPRYAFLDEATSALDPNNEERLYSLLARSDIRYLSTGHRPSLLRYHRYVLDLRGGEDWTLVESPEFVAPSPTRAA